MFKDHFSDRPAEYARYRPGYPDTLFEFLAACCEHRRLVESGYADIPIPGKALETPSFEMCCDWRANDMLGYLRTWSAVKRYEAVAGSDPVARIEDRLVAAWGSASRSVVWPLQVLVSRF